jgi:hypothetical protein
LIAEFLNEVNELIIEEFGEYESEDTNSTIRP